MVEARKPVAHAWAFIVVTADTGIGVEYRVPVVQAPTVQAGDVPLLV